MSVQAIKFQPNPNEVTDVIHKNGKLFLKTFLIDDTLNKLGWKMDPNYIDKYINTAIGRPAILNQIHFHPLEFNHIKSGSIASYIQAQEPYRIGTIKQLFPSSIPHNYSALIEITDPRIVKAYEDGSLKIPKYVSPAVYELNPSLTNKEIQDYEFLHLAFVDEPAYGTVKANVKGDCHGTEQTCMNHLAQAAIVSECNFCPVSELNKFTNTLDLSTSNSNTGITTDSSHIRSNPKQDYSHMTELNTSENKTQIDAPTSQQPSQTQEVKAVANTPVIETNKEAEIRSPIKVQTPQTQTQAQETEVTKQQQTESKPEELKVQVSASEELKQQLDILSKELAELKADKLNREKAEAEHKEHTKRELIEKYVTPDSCNGNEEDRERRIKAFMSMDIPIAELEHFLDTHYILPESPCSQAKVKQAGLNRRVTDYSKKEVPQSATDSARVKQAGIPLDEEQIRKAKKLDQFMSISSSNSGSRFI